MKNPKSFLLNAFIAQAALVPMAFADVIASTNFDGRTLTEVTTANDTASGLNWTVNGIADPGSMTSVNASGGGLVLFNANELVQNMFAPGINTGNGNTFWTTSVALTVLPGRSVTLTDVTFDSWSVSGAQVQNVNRRSDFTFTVLDPSGTEVASVDVVDSLSGKAEGVPTETATFASPVALTAPGTYTLGIKGGDFLEFNETGNHTAIDNLVINGSTDPGAGFTITDIVYDKEAGSLSLTWNSTPGTVYAVKVSDDMMNWDSDLDDGILGEDGETTTAIFNLVEANLKDVAKTFFRIEVQTEG
ncbi:hypothetical protein N9154_02670 [Akkermansiaceae bacterium]|nr:hypothetical protein [Akkermansiaceae bacterium]